MMLKGHTYKTFKTTPGTPECRDICLADERCQSFNVVMFIAICELNNRTKEARPEDFVKDEYRYYMAKGPKRGNRTCKNKIAGCLRLWILHSDFSNFYSAKEKYFHFSSPGINP